MRILSSDLLIEQRKPVRRPLVKIEIAAFGHPEAVPSSSLQWADFAWERLTSPTDTTAVGLHSVAIPADGSLCRVRAGSTIYYQRVTSPSSGSTWTSWSSWGGGLAGSPVAIAAAGTEVIAFSSDGVNLYYKKSTDSGVNFGSWTKMSNARPCERGCAAAFKPNGDVAVVHATDFNDPTSLYIQRRTSGTWSTGLGQISGDHAVSALAMYYNGDWNILALLLDGSYVRLARGVYGDGSSYPAGTWSGWEFINSYKARVDFSAAMHMRQFRTGKAGRSVPTYYERVSSIQQQRAVDNLVVDDPFLTYHASLGAVFSFAKDNQPWFYRLRPGTLFKDSDWSRAWPLDVTATYGLALACDGTYLYAAAPNQVWRTALPGSWAPPAAGSGAGTDYVVPSAHILAVREKVESLAASALEVTLDNSGGAYNSIGGGENSAAGKLKRGAQVTLSIGYRTATDLYSVAGKYYVERIAYARSPGCANVIIGCIDAWGLLQRYSFNRPVFWNEYTDAFTVYDLIEKGMQAVGGRLSYKSRSSDITAIYPRLEIHTGENAAVVLPQLLALVPDVIYFVGLTGYIVHPQATDPASYYLRFPQTDVASSHIILEASYAEESPQINRAFVIGTDAAAGQVSGSAVTQADVDLVGERMDAHHDPAIPTAAIATAVAAARLAKARLDGARAQVTIPPHCGLELWDVIAVTDTMCNRREALYRVAGYTLDYDTLKGIYRHQIDLCAV